MECAKVGVDSGFTTGLAACGRIWGVCSPDARTPLCAAGWLIFITAHNDRAREWGPWLEKARGNKRVASGKKRKGGGGGRGDGWLTENNREEKDKGNSRAEKLCFHVIARKEGWCARYTNHVCRTLKSKCGVWSRAHTDKNPNDSKWLNENMFFFDLSVWIELLKWMFYELWKKHETTCKMKSYNDVTLNC